jgi:hypothetical protein
MHHDSRTVANQTGLGSTNSIESSYVEIEHIKACLVSLVTPLNFTIGHFSDQSRCIKNFIPLINIVFHRHNCLNIKRRGMSCLLCILVPLVTSLMTEELNFYLNVVT